MSRQVSTTVYVELEGPETEGHEVGEIEVEVTGYVAAFRPARLSGLPENCSPAEGGDVEDFKATVNGLPFVLSWDEETRAIERLQEEAADRAEADYDAAMEARGEALRDARDWD